MKARDGHSLGRKRKKGLSLFLPPKGRMSTYSPKTHVRRGEKRWEVLDHMSRGNGVNSKRHGKKGRPTTGKNSTRIGFRTEKGTVGDKRNHKAKKLCILGGRKGFSQGTTISVRKKKHWRFNYIKSRKIQTGG